MEDFQFDFGGAPVVFSNKPPPIHNPLNRPDINYKKFAIALTGFFVQLGIFFAVAKFWLGEKVALWLDLPLNKAILVIVAITSAIYIACILKRGLIWLVHVYQHYAPDEMRLKCVFEPSCSEYMILSIKKYGPIFGTLKGC